MSRPSIPLLSIRFVSIRLGVLIALVAATMAASGQPLQHPPTCTLAPGLCDCASGPMAVEAGARGTALQQSQRRQQIEARNRRCTAVQGLARRERARQQALADERRRIGERRAQQRQEDRRHEAQRQEAQRQDRIRQAQRDDERRRQKR